MGDPQASTAKLLFSDFDAPWLEDVEVTESSVKAGKKENYLRLIEREHGKLVSCANLTFPLNVVWVVKEREL